MSLFTVIESREEFENMILNSDICVVDFFATWCGPCKSLSKTLDNLSETNKILKQATFIKVDCDEFPDLAELYEVSALPYLVFFKNGKLTDNYVKGNNPNAVIEVIKSLL